MKFFLLINVKMKTIIGLKYLNAKAEGELFWSLLVHPSKISKNLICT